MLLALGELFLDGDTAEEIGDMTDLRETLQSGTGGWAIIGVSSSLVEICGGIVLVVASRCKLLVSCLHCFGDVSLSLVEI